MRKDFKVSIQVYNTQYSTKQKAIHLKLFWPKITILTSKSAKYQHLQKSVIEIFFKLGYHEYFFEFIK